MIYGKDGKVVHEIANKVYISQKVSLVNNSPFSSNEHDIEALLLARLNYGKDATFHQGMLLYREAHADCGFIYCQTQGGLPAINQIQMKFNSLDDDEIIWPAGAGMYILNKGELEVKKLYLANMATSGGGGATVDVYFWFSG